MKKIIFPLLAFLVLVSGQALASPSQPGLALWLHDLKIVNGGQWFERDMEATLLVTPGPSAASSLQTFYVELGEKVRESQFVSLQQPLAILPPGHRRDGKSTVEVCFELIELDGFEERIWPERRGDIYSIGLECKKLFLDGHKRILTVSRKGEPAFQITYSLRSYTLTLYEERALKANEFLTLKSNLDARTNERHVRWVVVDDGRMVAQFGDRWQYNSKSRNMDITHRTSPGEIESHIFYTHFEATTLRWEIWNDWRWYFNSKTYEWASRNYHEGPIGIARLCQDSDRDYWFAQGNDIKVGFSLAIAQLGELL